MYAHAGMKENDPGGALGGTEAEPTLKVPHVLSDGADSMGLLMASTRVYVNEGCMHELWTSKAWPINPFDLKESLRRNFEPGEFDLISEARKDPNSPWMQTEKRMPNMALFLGTWDSFPLASAKEIEREGKPGKDGKDCLTNDPAVLTRGKIVFADNCARCHSSKRPDLLPRDPEAQKNAWRELVQRDDFLKGNYPLRRRALSRFRARHQRSAQHGYERHGGEYLGPDVQPGYALVAPATLGLLAFAPQEYDQWAGAVRSHGPRHPRYRFRHAPLE